MHTRYSDGSGTHDEIAAAAMQSGIDVVVVTDHNVLVRGAEKYYRQDNQRLLMLVGEEIHNPTRVPQKSHLLIVAAGKEMSALGDKPQQVIDHVQRAGGLSFIAHPHDPELKAFHEDDISWEDWDVRGYTGIELWNGFSELKRVVRSKLEAYFYAFFPRYIAQGPHPLTLKKWDELTANGQKVVAIGGSDAHAMKMHRGPIRRTIFPYTFHFSAINTHLLVERPLSGDLESDREMVLNALRRGHAFVGYDLPASTQGFRFTAQGKDGSVWMGDEIRVHNGVTLQVRLPFKTECRLLHNGNIIRTWQDREICVQIVSQPGVYRVECSVDYLGRQRGWIYSNPIYVR